MLTLIDSIKIHETASASSLPTVSSPSLSLSVASSAAQQSASTTVGVGCTRLPQFVIHPNQGAGTELTPNSGWPNLHRLVLHVSPVQATPGRHLARIYPWGRLRRPSPLNRNGHLDSQRHRRDPLSLAKLRPSHLNPCHRLHLTHRLCDLGESAVF
jgi:hypothetical protein